MCIVIVHPTLFSDVIYMGSFLCESVGTASEASTDV